MNEDLESSWILRGHSYNSPSCISHSTIVIGLESAHGRSLPVWSLFIEKRIHDNFRH